jgi:hypothetical protein
VSAAVETRPTAEGGLDLPLASERLSRDGAQRADFSDGESAGDCAVTPRELRAS